MKALTSSERVLLEWLGKEDYSQHGECGGSTLDSLVAKGLAQIHTDGKHQEGFIARGRGDMYHAVSLTEAGRKALLEV
jgi:hypothetical protein